MLRYLPNIITLLRLALIVPTCFFLLNQQYDLAFYLFVFAGMSDAIDGFLARHYNWSSRLGAIIDPLADKLLIIACLGSLAWAGYIPVSLFLIVVLRDLWIIIGASLYHYKYGRYVIAPRSLSKINTFIQIIFVGLHLSNLSIITMSNELLKAWLFLTYLGSIITWLDYTVVWGRRAWLQSQQKRLSI